MIIRTPETIYIPQIIFDPGQRDQISEKQATWTIPRSISLTIPDSTNFRHWTGLTRSIDGLFWFQSFSDGPQEDSQTLRRSPKERNAGWHSAHATSITIINISSGPDPSHLCLNCIS